MTSPSVAFRPLLDELAPPPPRTQPHWFRKWGVRIVCGVGVAGCIAARVAALSPFANAASNFGIGLSAQWLIHSFFEESSLPRVYQIALTVFGQASFIFPLTQLYDNVDDSAVQALATGAIGGGLGAYVAMYARQFKEQHYTVRIEEEIDNGDFQERFRDIFLRQNWSDYFKFTAAGLCGVGRLFCTDTVVNEVISFTGCFLVTEIVGERFCLFVEGRIKRAEPTEQGALTTLRGTRWRQLKVAINTVGFFAIPLSFIPFTSDAHTATRVAQLPVIGIIAGSFDGFMYRSVENRLKTVPLSRLEEVHEKAPLNHLAFKIWKIVWPLLALGLITAFVGWQEGFQLDQIDDRIALVVMYATFIPTFLLANRVDSSWKVQQRSLARPQNCLSLLKDKALCNLVIAPRIFGTNPVYPFFVVTNAMMMDDRSLESTEQLSHRILIHISWASFGTAMAIELQRTLSDKVGTAFQFPLMAVVNGVLTIKRQAAGTIP